MTNRDRNVDTKQKDLPVAESQETNQPAVAEDDPDADVPAVDTEKSLGKTMLMKVALATVLVASLVISIANLMITNQLRSQTDEYQAEIKDYKEKIARLKYFINKDVDDDYIIEYAREYLDMYFPDEEIYYNDVNE